MPPVSTPKSRPQRLSGQDASFIAFEREGRPMHFGAVIFFEASAWRDSTGRFDTSGLRELLVSRAARIDGLRRLIAPGSESGWPRWSPRQADDIHEGFEVCEPGASHAQVQQAAAASMARPLERSRPMWRVSIVPPAAADARFALVLVAHHALVDGIAGLEILERLFDDGSPAQAEPGDAPSTPRSPQGQPALLRTALLTTKALLRTVVGLLRPGPKSEFVGPNHGGRSVAWASVSERDVRAAARALRASSNDVLLAAVAKAMRRTLTNTDAAREVRVAVPVSFRPRQDRAAMGNQLGLLLVPLSLRPMSDRRIVERVRRETSKLKDRGDAVGYAILCRITSLTGRRSQAMFHRTTARIAAFTMLVTNVPGSFKNYSIGGAAIAEIHPMAPLFHRQQANVAVVRQAGMLRIGVVASWQEAGRANAFVSELARCFEEIAAEAALHTPSTPTPAVVA